MNQQQAVQLLRLRESDDAAALFKLLSAEEDKALTALRKQNVVVEIHRSQGELRVHDYIRQLFSDAEVLLKQGD